jgi:hypothetical protein
VSAHSLFFLGFAHEERDSWGQQKKVLVKNNVRLCNKFKLMFDRLPTELYESIFSHVSSSELQQTLLSVTRAIPLSPVPISHLFHSIRITYPARAVHLYRRLRPKERNNSNLAADLVKEFSVECWSVDAEVIVNLIHLLPKLQTLNIWVGPDSFTPEHLEELFLKPFLELKYLSLRFRP